MWYIPYGAILWYHVSCSSYSYYLLYMIYPIWYHIMVLNIKSDFERPVYLCLLLVTPTGNGFLPWRVLALFCCWTIRWRREYLGTVKLGEAKELVLLWYPGSWTSSRFISCSFGPKMIRNLPIITQYIANDTSPRLALPKRQICSDRRHDISRELCWKLLFKSHCFFSHDLSKTFHCLRFLFCEHPFTRDLSPAFSADLQVCCFLELWRGKLL